MLTAKPQRLDSWRFLHLGSFPTPMDCLLSKSNNGDVDGEVENCTFRSSFHRVYFRRRAEKCFILQDYTQATDKGLLSKIIKQLIQLNIRKTAQSKKWAEDLNRHFPKKIRTDGQKTYEKRGSTSLIMRDMQIQTMVRDHLTLVRRAIHHQKCMNNIRWRGCGEKGTLLHCGWECKLIQAVMGNGIEIP